MDTATHLDVPTGDGLEADANEAQPFLIVAPELRGLQGFAAIREPGDTDEGHRARCDLLALVLGHAKQG